METTSHTFQILSYGMFYDFPHGMYVKVAEQVIELESSFDEATDNYKDYFEVSLVVDAAARDVQMGTFRSQHYKRLPLGELPVREVTFDVSKRRSFKSAKLEAMLAAHNLTG